MTRISALMVFSIRGFSEAFCFRIQNDLKILTERLSRINDSLARKVTLHANCLENA